MKKLKINIQIIFTCAVVATLSFSGCGNSNSPSIVQNADTAAQDKTKAETAQKGEVADTAKVDFNINDIPVTTKDIGTFPYLKAPEGYKYNDITKSDLAVIHFAVKGHLLAIEGKSYGTNVVKIQESEGAFSMLTVQRAYDKAIKDLGGVEVSNRLLPGEVEKIGQKILDREGNHAYTIIGVNEYTLNNLNTYVIRTAEAEVWIELSYYQNGGYIHILQKEAGK